MKHLSVRQSFCGPTQPLQASSIYRVGYEKAESRQSKSLPLALSAFFLVLCLRRLSFYGVKRSYRQISSHVFATGNDNASTILFKSNAGNVEHWLRFAFGPFLKNRADAVIASTNTGIDAGVAHCLHGGHFVSPVRLVDVVIVLHNQSLSRGKR